MTLDNAAVNGMDFIHSILAQPPLLISATSALISIISLFFTLLIFWETRKRGLSAARFGQTMEFLNEWRNELRPYRDHLYSIRDKITHDPKYWALGYSNQAKEDRDAIVAVSEFLDYVGWTAISGNIDEQLLLTHIGPPICTLWMVLRNCLMAEREERRTKNERPGETEVFMIGGRLPGPYGAGFEHLAQMTWEKYAKLYLTAEEATFEVPGYPRLHFRSQR